MEIHVLQGERSLLNINKPGPFRARRYCQHHAVLPQIEVTFNIDANGILQCYR